MTDSDGLRCIWCDESKITISTSDYEPCTECRTKMLAGITVIEIESASKHGRVPIVANLAPTKRWETLTEDEFKKVAIIYGFGDPQIIAILSNRLMFVEHDIFETILAVEVKDGKAQ